LSDGLPERVVAFHACPQEILAITNFLDDGGVRRTCGAEQGLRGCSVHLHTVLTVEQCASLAFQPFITIAPRLWSKMTASLPPRKRNVLPARNTTRHFLRTRSPIACKREKLAWMSWTTSSFTTSRS